MTATATRPDAPTPPQRQSLLGRALAFVRNTWRGLTSMRTALALLFLLALAAIPGALLPQRALNEQKVEQYIADRPTLGPWMDRLELFDVFSSFWFTAVYVLLFVSLVGCICRAASTISARCAPRRCRRRATSLGCRTTTAPSSTETPKQVGDPGARAAAGLAVGAAGQPIRARRTPARSPSRRRRVTPANSATWCSTSRWWRCWSSIAVGKLFGYEGAVIVIADDGPGFCSTSPAAFDSFRAGNVRDGTGMAPICVRVKDFKADYLDNGQAEMFTSNIAYQAGDGPRRPTPGVTHPAGQPSAAGGGGPGLPAGARLRADLHRHLPQRGDPHRDAAVATRRRQHVPVQRGDALRPAGRHVSRRRRAPQEPDRAARGCSRRPRRCTARCFRRASRR